MSAPLVTEKPQVMVNDDLTKFGTTKGVIVLEILKPATPDQLTSRATRDLLAVECRNRGFPMRGISNSPTPFPIDANGESHEDMVLGKREYIGWRVEYEVSAGVGG